MNRQIFPLRFLLFLAALTWLSACDTDQNDHAREPQPGAKTSLSNHHDHAHHGHHAPTNGGVEFVEGKGLKIDEHTSSSLNLATADVSTTSQTPQITIHSVIYQISNMGSKGLRKVLAHTWVTFETASQLSNNMSCSQHKNCRIIDLNRSPAQPGSLEVIVESLAADGTLELGSSLDCKFDLGRNPSLEPSLVVPSSAVLNTAKGTFVYVVNGPHLLRTAVETGGNLETEDLIIINDGLYEGDTVVTHPVETLHLIELHAIKGGAHCH
jgi:hypothetical protein